MSFLSLYSYIYGTVAIYVQCTISFILLAYIVICTYVTTFLLHMSYACLFVCDQAWENQPCSCISLAHLENTDLKYSIPYNFSVWHNGHVGLHSNYICTYVVHMYTCSYVPISSYCM